MKLLLLISVLIASFTVVSQSAEKDIIGIWMTELKDARVQVYQKNDLYYGKVIWLKEPNGDDGKPVCDGNNPVESLKSRPIIGLQIITKMSYTGKEWSGGEIYDPKSGDTYTCKLWFENGKLKVRGYLGWFFDTKTWTKVS